LAYPDKRFLHVTCGFDVVPFENRFCLVACDLHRYATVNPGLNQVASRAPVKIMGH
jgi:hypothetical protein